MTRRKGDRVDGWLVLDKPAGISSAAALGRARRLFNAAKAGHAGTLDPLATGVLVLAFGEATKLISHVIDADKAYRFTIRWGEARDTDDAQGAVIARSERRPRADEIAAAIPSFTGSIMQVPPVYSALKLAGKPAYARARAGEVVTPAARQVHIHRLELVDIPDPDHATFMVECGKGTYIRSLARDIAEALGTVGHVAMLRRTVVGRFTEAAAIPLENLEALGHSPAAFAYLQAVETALDDIPALAVTAADSLRLRQGQSIAIPRVAVRPVDDGTDPAPLAAGKVVAATLLGRLVALTRVEDGRLHPLRVLNLEPGRE
ncbi:MAG TPA: tRNA pseudouridine(55) synthase TruB [Alphaproteobacteria bacterium]